MKNKLLSFAFCFYISYQASTQTFIQFINNNNVDAKITNIGPLFFDGVQSVFNVPKASNKSTIFAASPWIGGISNNQLHLMAETYRQGPGLADIQSGPISNSYLPNFLNYWNRIWKVSKTDIQNFRNTIQLGQKPDTILFKNIIEWPAKGNVFGNDTLSAYAPFIDVNHNNKYEPFLGDYPFIKGDICTFTIMNDDITHTESNGLPLRFQLQRMAYEFETNNAVNNTLFVDYSIINKSGIKYDSVIFSSWVDFDLGNYADDYIGTDTLRNMIYAFNGDSIDDGIKGYGSTPPAQACVFINSKLWASATYNNDFSAAGNPTNARDYFNYMQGNRKDGKPVLANTIDSNTLIKTQFIYNGNPCLNTGWWEGSAKIMPGDRRILASLAPQSLLPNQSINVTLAFVYARAASGNNIASVCALANAVDEVTTWYNNQQFGAVNELAKKTNFSIYPNPAKTEITIEAENIKNAEIYIYDRLGNKVKSTILNETRSVSIADLSAGIYLIQLQTENGNALEKLIIQ